MPITDHQAKYLAHVLTRKHPSDSAEKLAGTLVDAKVDLNPHQVEAALFAFKSPFSKGAILADEVGLGKTIEAGLVISQKWAEKKGRVLIIAPSNLRKQWFGELAEKFFLPSVVLEAKSYNAAKKAGNAKPFLQDDAVVICSYQFAKSKSSDVEDVPWDLVVIDEAHRLRNVYKPNNVIANVLKDALQNCRKLLLTATPLQNSLMELYGLVSIIDEQAFGDVKSFREQYARPDDDSTFEALKARLKPLCHRTLRKQVLQYVPYTARHAMTERFTPSEDEHTLYEMVSEYLQRDNLQALPVGQRALITLVLRKLLASSTFAIAGALNTMVTRLDGKLKADAKRSPLADELDEDYEALDEIADEWDDEEGEDPPMTPDEAAAVAREIEELRTFRGLAQGIEENAKGLALLKVLGRAFAEAQRLGGARKAIVFTESRKTQDYLVRLLAENGHGDGLLLFNGSNADARSKAIYNDWVKRHRGSDRITGSRTADMRSALVDYFQDEGRIMIATEAGAEGINLQFCSLVVNYDLPWNPQRVEQRIGRCHRYGQKSDVVVVNFINQKNEADQRVFELLSEKFKLFEGVFGASDEVLGAIESGVDIERKIADIYQGCRKPEEIREAFDRLQMEFDFDIKDALKRTRTSLLENFDEDVQEKLKVGRDRNARDLNRYERMLMRLSGHELWEVADFTEDGNAFTLRVNPFDGADGAIPLGKYELPRRSDDSHFYRLGHPLAVNVLARAKARELNLAEVTFDATNTRPKMGAVERYIGVSGELMVSLVTITALDQIEEYLIVVAVTDDGGALPGDVAERLLRLDAVRNQGVLGLLQGERLEHLTAKDVAEAKVHAEDRNAGFYRDETQKLSAWADDLITSAEKALRDTKAALKEANLQARKTVTLAEGLEVQTRVRDLEVRLRRQRQEIDRIEDETIERRNAMMDEARKRTDSATAVQTLFALRWRII